MSDLISGKKKKLAFIIPYFGIFPNYFQLFLYSCSKNTDFEWLFFTDNTETYTYPENVKKVVMTFDECKKLIQSKFDFKISLSSAKKLCDYKCAYGEIFEDWIKEYEWWGHCDTDQIFGCLKSFLTDEMFSKYVKIGNIGHMTLYRNDPTNNRIYRRVIDGRERYREVFTTENGCGFDEWIDLNINDIFANTGLPVYWGNIGADINPYCTVLRTVDFDLKEHFYKTSTISVSVYGWKNGHLMQYWLVRDELQAKEYPYIHLQKRKMWDYHKCSEEFYIIHNAFVDKDEITTLLAKERLWLILNLQYFRVKWKNFRYRIKKRDWHFSSVFR